MERAEAFRAALLGWYGRERRDLPWRRTLDPYAIWVSEIMLQQTTVATVAPRWGAFLARFPDVHALASAEEDEVVHEWRGLGYYRRARHLHAAARLVVRELGGRVPSARAELLRLPGVGDYAAAAIASIAAGEPVAVFDANVRRVAARLLACEVPADSAHGAAILRAEVAQLLDGSRPGDFNQAMMELGAVVCLPRGPSCHECPVSSFCTAHARGRPESYPVLSPRAAKHAVRHVSIIVQAGEEWLWLRRGEGGSFAGMWETPRGEAYAGEDLSTAAARVLLETTGIAARPEPLEVVIAHTVMNTRIRLHAAGLVLPSRIEPRVRRHSDHAWAVPAEAEKLPMSSSQHRLLKGLNRAR